ncbi:MAG: hypothetical protein AAFN93_21965 [Bacteroidota bacterium]
MDERERNLDDLYNAATDLNILARKYKYLLSDENAKTVNNDKLTVKDIMFSQRKIAKFESDFKEAALDFVELGKKQEDELQNLIVQEEVLIDTALEFVFRAMSSKSKEWSVLLEKCVIEVIEDLGRKGGNYEMYHLYALLMDLPDKLYSKESDYTIRLIDTIKNSRDVKLVYCLTSFLWKQNYTYQIVIDTFTKNLSHVDWRIRLITNECLRTWKREFSLNDLYVSTPKVLDRIKAKMNKI